MAIEERWAENPYYSPEACGLTLLAAIDDADAYYSFDMVVVWKDNQSGRLYWGADSGCSCPSPFEGVRSLADLERLTSVRVIEEQFATEQSVRRDLAERRDFISKVRAELAKPAALRKGPA